VTTSPGGAVDEDVTKESKVAFLREVSEIADGVEMMLKLMEAHPYVAFCALTMMAGSLAAEHTGLSKETAVSHLKSAYDIAKQSALEAKSQLS
jgi:hypothetical protein